MKKNILVQIYKVEKASTNEKKVEIEHTRSTNSFHFNSDFRLFTCDCLNMATMATVGLRQILRVSQGISARGLSCSAVNKKEYSK